MTLFLVIVNKSRNRRTITWLLTTFSFSLIDENSILASDHFSWFQFTLVENWINLTSKWHQSNIKSTSIKHQNDIKMTSKYNQNDIKLWLQNYIKPTSNESLGLTKKPEIFPVICLTNQNYIKTTSNESLNTESKLHQITSNKHQWLFWAGFLCMKTGSKWWLFMLKYNINDNTNYDIYNEKYDII